MGRFAEHLGATRHIIKSEVAQFNNIDPNKGAMARKICSMVSSAARNYSGHN
jgi:hypothetical protein